MTSRQSDGWDVAVIGAGPAGLTAAMYLGRFRRRVLVLHDGHSRALRIPQTHNAPSHPDGISGPDLIARMMSHARGYDAVIEEAEITGVERARDLFRLTAADGRGWTSRAVILATGIRLHEIDLPRDVHEAAIQAGALRYCPVCDGFEHIGRRIGVIGCDTNGAAEALFLRRYSDDITLMPLSHPELSPQQAAELAAAGITVVTGSLRGIELADSRLHVRLADRNTALAFDVIYPALGTTPRSELAIALGLPVEDDGAIAARAVRDGGVPGVAAAGDVVEGLDQISVALGHGALAATSIHNWLRDRDQHSLQDRSD